MSDLPAGPVIVNVVKLPEDPAAPCPNSRARPAGLRSRAGARRRSRVYPPQPSLPDRPASSTSGGNPPASSRPCRSRHISASSLLLHFLPAFKVGYGTNPLTPARIHTTANGGRREGERSSPDLGDSPDLPADPPRPGRSAPASRMTCSRCPTRWHATAGSATTLTRLPLTPQRARRRARRRPARLSSVTPPRCAQQPVLYRRAHRSQRGHADTERISRDDPDQRS